MKIYNYHPQTGELINVANAVANPLESGKYLIPAHSTITQPPRAKKGSVLVYNIDQNSWETRKDYRGQTAFSTVDMIPVAIDYIGEVKEGYTLKQPRSPLETWRNGNWQLDIDKLKLKKIQELEAYHYSDDVRNLKINGCVLKITSEGRDLIAEQIKNLEMQIQLGELNQKDAKFTYYSGSTSVGITIDISLKQLKRIYVLAMDLVNTNFKVYKDHIKKINNLRSRNSIENYNFKTNYLTKQEIIL